MVAPNGKCHYDDSIKPNKGLYHYINEREDDILQVINLVRKKYNVDDKRIYLTGCSMGCFGTWHIGSRQTYLPLLLRFAGLEQVNASIVHLVI